MPHAPNTFELANGRTNFGLNVNAGKRAKVFLLESVSISYRLHNAAIKLSRLCVNCLLGQLRRGL